MLNCQSFVLHYKPLSKTSNKYGTRSGSLHANNIFGPIFLLPAEEDYMPDLPPNAHKKASTSFLARNDLRRSRGRVKEKTKNTPTPVKYYFDDRLHLRFIHGAP